MALHTLISIAFVSGYWASVAAKRRNRHVGLWAVAGFLFPISLLVIWSLRPLQPRMPAPTAVSR